VGVDLTHFIVFTNEALNEDPEGSTPSGPVLRKNPRVAHQPNPHPRASCRAQEQANRCQLAERALHPPQRVKRKMEVRGDSGKPTKHLCLWGSCLMGATSSPYQTGQGMGMEFMKEVVMGNRNDLTHVLG
jgi:hypothetical protein